jgi:hypothetical protein
MPKCEDQPAYVIAERRTLAGSVIRFLKHYRCVPRFCPRPIAKDSSCDRVEYWYQNTFPQLVIVHRNRAHQPFVVLLRLVDASSRAFGQTFDLFWQKIDVLASMCFDVMVK